MIKPGWREVAVLAAIICRLASPSGPNILYQERSIRWEAIFWPPLSRFVVVERCVRGLKYPRDVEKFENGFRLGKIRVWAISDSSRARAIPRAVTTRAVILMDRGIVMGGVFIGSVNEVIRNPAVMLPSARRVIGEVTAGLFSLTGVRDGIRVNPVWTSRVMRMV